jgi:hypothetical protein
MLKHRDNFNFTFSSNIRFYQNPFNKTAVDTSVRDDIFILGYAKNLILCVKCKVVPVLSQDPLHEDVSLPN